MARALDFRKSKGSFALFLLMFAAFIVVAKSISIDARKAPYNAMPQIEDVTANSEFEIRSAAQYALVGMYRTINGLSSVSIGDVLDVTYGDGSKDEGLVACFTGTACVQPVDGLGGSLGGGGGGGSGGPGGAPGNDGGGGAGGGAGDPLLCTPPCRTGSVTVGG